MTVMGMLSNGRTLMAMASLMFAPVPLEEVSCTFCKSINGHDDCMQCFTTCSMGILMVTWPPLYPSIHLRISTLSDFIMSSNPPLASDHEQCKLRPAVVCGPCHPTQGSQCLPLSQGSSLPTTSYLLQPCTLSGYLCIPAIAGQYTFGYLTK